jgi:hypothetical protein
MTEEQITKLLKWLEDKASDSKTMVEIAIDANDISNEEYFRGKYFQSAITINYINGMLKE